MVTRGFFGKKDKNDRVPPGQYLENRFPVLSAEPTPKIALSDWKLSIIYKNEEGEIMYTINANYSYDNENYATSATITSVDIESNEQNTYSAVFQYVN